MRFLIINTDYPEFLAWLYSRHPGLEKQPYEEQMRVRTESLFGVADFYSSNLRKLGHEAWDIHANNGFMQRAWALEHMSGFEEPRAMPPWCRELLQEVRRVGARTPLRFLKRFVRPVLRSLDRPQTLLYEILSAQIKHHKPDVLLNQDVTGISSSFLRQMKSYVRLLVGQHAATCLPEAGDFSCYDLVISSFPPTVEYFRQKGITAELSRMGFEPRVLSYLKVEERPLEVTFIGGFYGVHSSRAVLLEDLCHRFSQVRVWGPGIDHLPASSAIPKSYVGQAWGREMYQILHNSKVTLNHHGDIAPYANNMRLFEATGVGTLLITDWKANLHEMFEPGKEVVAYRTPEECAELIQYYLEHDDEREVIARAGQRRTLQEHTYYHRMQELMDIVERYLTPSSAEYELIDSRTATQESFNGWHDHAVAERQDSAYRILIQQMYAGQPRQDFVVAADAVRCTGIANPLILEVGCGSGYYSEILPHLLRRPVRYVGLDYSLAMIRLARKRYSNYPFMVGDAAALPFPDGTFDTVLNGVSLMHILSYESAISESRRVARRWCIFHTVPVLQRRETTIMRKRAYGGPTVEIIFNEKDLRNLLEKHGLAVRHILDSIPYNLEATLNEPTVTRTFVCEARE